jgi:myo-inositol 2-dehydrogenase/D-chiro-inositol 1-dehydrogenase
MGFTVSRRTFMVGAGALAAAPAISLGQGKKVFKFALVGCGGRGSGAAQNIIDAAKRMGHEAKLVAAADFFREKAVAVCKAHECDEKFAFGGADGYRKILAMPEVEIVLLATPPIFRPLHTEECVKAGKNVFAEKPIATDPPGIRRFLKACADAKAKGLAVLSGTCHRHNNLALRMIGPIRAGIIGDIRAGIVYRCHGGMSGANYLRARAAGLSNAAYLASNWYHFREMSSDHLCEQAVHEIDLANWFIGRLPERAMGIGARHQRVSGNIYDCFGIDYDYGKGLHVHAVARQINSCWDRCCTVLTGTKGQVDVLGSKILLPDGTTQPFPFDEKAIAGRDGNMYVAEHCDLLQSLLDGKPVNEGEQEAMATASGLLGTLAAYSGQMIRMNDLLTNADSPFYSWKWPVQPEDFESGKEVFLPPEDKPAVPGKPERAD